MIQLKTKLKVGDNSGARLTECIKVLGGAKYGIAHMGYIITISIKKIKIKKKIKGVAQKTTEKGDVCRALILRTRSPKLRKNGSSIKFNENSVLVLNKQNKFTFTRAYGPSIYEMRANKNTKVFTSISNLL